MCDDSVPPLIIIVLHITAHAVLHRLRLVLLCLESKFHILN